MSEEAIMTINAPATKATEAESVGHAESGEARLPHPLDDETRRREWKKLFDEYQKSMGPSQRKRSPRLGRTCTDDDLCARHRRADRPRPRRQAPVDEAVHDRPCPWRAGAGWSHSPSLERQPPSGAPRPRAQAVRRSAVGGQIARKASALCGQTGSIDVIDASVAVTASQAARHDDVGVVTSDRRDIGPLLAALGATVRIVDV